MMVSRALAYARRGWPVFPCEVGGKKPDGRLAPHGLHDATTDEQRIVEWWTEEPEANIGIPTGTASGFFTIDIDTKNNGPATWATLTADRGISRTANSRTPTGGTHYHFRMPTGITIRNSAGKIGRGVDVRGTGGYIVAAGSRRPEGAYAWGDSTIVADAPPWLVELVADRPQAVVTTTLTTTGAIPVGQRNDTFTRMAGSMRAKGFAAEAIEDALVKHNIVTRTGTPDSELRAIARNIGQKPVDDPAVRYELRLAAAVERERIKREARRRVDADSRADLTLPAAATLRRLAAVTSTKVVWRIEAMQPKASRAMLTAQFKSGKTTVVGNVVRSLVDGDPFLGQYAITPVAGTVALVDFEMSPGQLVDWLRDQQITNDDRVVVFSMRGKATTFDILDDHVRARWAAALRDHRAEYLVLDCVRPVLDALGLDENHDAGRFLVAFDALLTEAGIPDALLVHHMGHAGERARGDSRLRDWPDVEWRLVRQDENPASPRFLTAFGRDVDVPECALTFDPASRRLTISGGSRHDAKAAAALVDVLRVLKDAPEPLSGVAIKDALADSGHSRNAIDAALRLGSRSGKLNPKQGGHNAKLYSVSHQLPESQHTGVGAKTSSFPVSRSFPTADRGTGNSVSQFPRPYIGREAGKLESSSLTSHNIKET